MNRAAELLIMFDMVPLKPSQTFPLCMQVGLSEYVTVIWLKLRAQGKEVCYLCSIAGNSFDG